VGYVPGFQLRSFPGLSAIALRPEGIYLLTSNLIVRSRWVLMAGLLILGVAVAVTSSPKTRLGLVIIRSKATGAMPDIGWLDLFRMVRSGKHFNLPELARTPNPYAVIVNPYSSSKDVSTGSDLFRSHCVACHGANGEGGTGGPRLQLRRMVQGGSDWAIFLTVSSGVRGTAMPASGLPWLENWRLVAYVKSLVGGASRREPDAIREINPRTVGYGAIRDASENANSWLTYSGSYDSQRFSLNNQITPTTVQGLRLLWERQYDTSEPSIETSPLVVDGYMFVTVPPNRVEALDAKTGAFIWAYNHDLPTHLALCCGLNNRGLAVLGSMLYFGTLDAHLVALDIRTGRVVWDVQIADSRAGYSITSAPLALKNLIITGVAGGEFGIRGFIDARDAATGKAVWRFEAIPQPGQPGAETWAGNSAQTGGGPTWLTGSFEPETNLIYWPIGNPSPNFDGTGRAGDNLYTNSVVALDADRGSLRWYFQFSPHDLFDWDATEILVLLGRNIAGRHQRLLAQANRNGFLYLLDADTGSFLLAKPFAKQTWADGIDRRGRPQVIAGAQPTEKGTLIYPGVGGATNWESPTYSPVTGLMYVPVIDRGGIFTEGHTEYHPGELFAGGYFQFSPDDISQAAVRALNPITGEVKWEYRNHATTVGGLLSTGGGLVFGSQDEKFFALDAKTGHEMWYVSMGGRITAAPITFLCEGKQLVTIAAGHDILTFGP
jgi:alcohol dehydrogenase (cytochrome c)